MHFSSWLCTGVVNFNKEQKHAAEEMARCNSFLQVCNILRILN
jgi:hypothetical protein